MNQELKKMFLLEKVNSILKKKKNSKNKKTARSEKKG